MKYFQKAVVIGLLCAALAPAAHAGRYHHGHHPGGYGGGRWIAPALAGGLLTYALIQPRVIYAQPPVVAVPPPPVVGVASPAAIYYYCDSAQNFYPYTQACPEGWKVLPATPAH